MMDYDNLQYILACEPPGIIHQEGSTAATAHLTCLARPWKSQATCIATLQIGRRILRKPCPWLAENFWSSLNDQTFSGWKLPKWLEPGKCDAVIPFSNLTSTNFSQITTYLCNHLQEHIYSNNIVNKLVSTSFRNSLGVSPLMSVEEKMERPWCGVPMAINGMFIGVFPPLNNQTVGVPGCKGILYLML